MTTVRRVLYDALRPLLPAGYSLRPNAAPLEQIARPTVQIKLLAIRPTLERPTSSLTLDYVLTLVSPIASPQAAEDQLDGDVFTLCQALDKIPYINWVEARKVVAGSGNYVGYDVDVQMLTNPPEGE